MLTHDKGEPAASALIIFRTSFNGYLVVELNGYADSDGAAADATVFNVLLIGDRAIDKNVNLFATVRTLNGFDLQVLHVFACLVRLMVWLPTVLRRGNSKVAVNYLSCL